MSQGERKVLTSRSSSRPEAALSLSEIHFYTSGRMQRLWDGSLARPQTGGERSEEEEEEKEGSK